MSIKLLDCSAPPMGLERSPNGSGILDVVVEDSLTSVSAHTHWALDAGRSADATQQQQRTYVHGRSTQAGAQAARLLLLLLLRGAPAMLLAMARATWSGPPVPTSVVSSTSPCLLNLSAKKQPLAPGHKIS